ncbi:hypothetical protein WICMUC_001443 [Wickerhamomyces mucosus]|uniref:Uncharacterized protein n=1 Tax=Wickerhamomyces mucosus TaxID=1378264 RepID=A0A9P8THD3_9ASCO|nr:hypothetical protein WICMUC_001443 [Wickerhamomyces mucosus]
MIFSIVNLLYAQLNPKIKQPTGILNPILPTLPSLLCIEQSDRFGFSLSKQANKVKNDKVTKIPLWKKIKSPNSSCSKYLPPYLAKSTPASPVINKLAIRKRCE